METKELVDRIAERPYLFVEHALVEGETLPFRSHPVDHRSFVVIQGSVELAVADAGGGLDVRRHDRLDGWHALPGSVYRITAVGGPAAVIEAGSRTGPTVETGAAGVAAPGVVAISGYTVDKPWGHELWYTQNLPDAPYALKQIHMTAGFQSSLQSHRHKTETNYVIDGEATVLNGLPAPADLDAVIDLAAIPASVHGPRSGWSSAPGEIHRVIARSDYTSIEISTPELDDVIRWQDDTGRAHGRIESEHTGGGR